MMKSKVSVPKRTAGRRPSHRPLADDGCPRCGVSMMERRSTLRLPVNGEEVSVRNALHLACPKCREIVLRTDDARRLNEDGVATYRRKHGLLSGDQIRDIRRQHKLNQAQFARLLRLGDNTLSRWETGRNVQTAALDALLRLVGAVPEAITYLRASSR